MILEENNLQTVQEWTKSYIELIALYVHPKNSNHLRSHLRAIMALDHSRLGLENKFLENKSGRIFLRSTSLLYKIWLTSLGACELTYYTFYISHLGWNSTMRRGFYHTDLGQHYFTILKYKLHSFNIQDDRSTRGLLAKPLKNFPKSPIRPAGCELWSVWMNINRATLQHNKEFIFYLGVLSTPAGDVHERLKTNGTAIKIARETTDNT